MKSPEYAVVPHLEFFRITGLTGAAALVLFKEEKVASDVCKMLGAAYEQGAQAKHEEVQAGLTQIAAEVKKLVPVARR